MRTPLAMLARTAGASSPLFIATALAQDNAEAARAQRPRVGDRLRPKLPKLAPASTTPTPTF